MTSDHIEDFRIIDSQLHDMKKRILLEFWNRISDDEKLFSGKYIFLDSAFFPIDEEHAPERSENQKKDRREKYDQSRKVLYIRKTHREIDSADEYQKPEKGISEELCDLTRRICTRLEAVHISRFLDDQKDNDRQQNIEKKIRIRETISREVDSRNSVSNRSDISRDQKTRTQCKNIERDTKE